MASTQPVNGAVRQAGLPALDGQSPSILFRDAKAGPPPAENRRATPLPDRPVYRPTARWKAVSLLGWSASRG